MRQTIIQCKLEIKGVENGKLLLTTESIITSKRITVYTAGWNENEKKFLTAEEELNNACTDNIKLTEEQDKQVSEIRSIKVEDIDRVTGYDKTTFGAENDSVYKYGNEVKYSLAKDENRNSNRNTISIR